MTTKKVFGARGQTSASKTGHTNAQIDVMAYADDATGDQGVLQVWIGSDLQAVLYLDEDAARELIATMTAALTAIENARVVEDADADPDEHEIGESGGGE